MKVSQEKRHELARDSFLSVPRHRSIHILGARLREDQELLVGKLQPDLEQYKISTTPVRFHMSITQLCRNQSPSATSPESCRAMQRDQQWGQEGLLSIRPSLPPHQRWGFPHLQEKPKRRCQLSLLLGNSTGVKLANVSFLHMQFWELAVILPAGSTKQEQTDCSPTPTRSLPMADNGTWMRNRIPGPLTWFKNVLSIWGPNPVCF